MRKFHIALLLVAAFSTQQVMADNMGMTGEGTLDKSCRTIAKACKKAGFGRHETANESKRFWFDCMKPVILGQSVSGVNVDTNIVSSCRTHKIEEMQKEIQEMKKS